MVVEGHQRNQAILRTLNDQGSVRSKDLAKKLKVSEMTIRRDLLELEQQGLLRRVHGGATALVNHMGYGLRQKKQHEEKRALARQAALLVAPRQNIYLDAGTTAMEVAKALVKRNRQQPLHIQVITHGVNIATELIGHSGIAVHQIGGELYRDTFGAGGPGTAVQIRSFYFDYFFLAICGAEPTAGWTNTNLIEVEIKQAAMERARSTYVIADSSKWNQVSFVPIAPLGAANGWITDAALPKEAHKRLKALGLEVIMAPEEGGKL